MKETMGQIIKRLRKERNFTQEELAEQLGITFQAVSKWENDTGMPDVSQIIPLATIFGVSTDVLFGMSGKGNREEVQRIIQSAIAFITEPATKESVYLCYNALLDGLKKYPNNTTLLSQCLEIGISLAYPENDIYDGENGKKIYQECVRQADLVIQHSPNATDILRAHMIMVLLHSAYGNMESAREHANTFPWRADMTIYKMNAHISHYENDYYAESIQCQYDFLYHLEAMLDDMVELGCSYCQLNDYVDARYTLSDAVALIELVCKREDIMPSLHCRERGDIYALLAGVYLKEKKTDEALQMLKKMVCHDLLERSKYKSHMKMCTPLLRDTDNSFYKILPNIKQRLLKKLDNPAFDDIRENDDFLKLLENVNRA